MSLTTTIDPTAEPELDPTSGAAPGSVATSPASPAVTLRGVTKTFDPAQGPVIEDLSLEVAKGELVAVLGASGCGKSTLLGLVAGLDRPTSGQIVTPGGRPALMFQDASLFPWLTARGNVELALRLRRGEARRNRNDRRAEADRWLDLVRLGLHADKRPHEMSGGMRQRVALARALAQGADLLLMDEPFAALDAITRDVLHEELGRIRAETGLTVLFVTHNVREAVRLGDRVVLLASRPGRIVREWTVPIPHPRRIESPAVGALAVEITEQLRQEIRRHAR
jgi:NitT/TauT family transport system ATP-binding protein